MDGDLAVETELDSFSRTLPLPYRIAFIVVLGVWAWGVNLQYLYRAEIDVPSLIRYPLRSSLRLDPPHYLATYRLATVLTIPLILSLLLFWLLSKGSLKLVIYYDFLPLSYLVYLLLIFFHPFRRFSSHGRNYFLATLRRIAFGGIAHTSDEKFGDILLADVLTSYAKVFADFFVALCMFFARDGSATQSPNRACGGEYIVPLLIAIPSAIRLRQCITEYRRVKQTNAQHGGISTQGWGGQHLANALKYATAFPVTLLSALQRNLSVDQSHGGVTGKTLFRLWLLSVFLNSIYSFYWDVAKDWGLQVFTTLSTSPPSFPRVFLRPHLMFPSPNIYYVAILMDFCLRFAWSLKLSPHLDHFADFESGIFLLELLEVVRRWVWLFLRIETEWIRGLGSSTGMGMGEREDGVNLELLGDYDYENGSGREQGD